MQVLISTEGHHLDAAGTRIPHAMVVDGHLVLIDLTGVTGTLIDPTITRVTWGPQIDGDVIRDGGTIVRQNGGRQQFWDRALLQPYLDAYTAKRAELEVVAGFHDGMTDA